MNEKEGTVSRTPLYFVISLGVLFAAVVLLILIFMNKNQERIIGQNQQYLEDAASQTVQGIEEMFDHAEASIAMVSRVYELQLTTPQFDYHLLNEMSEPTPFDHIRFVGLNGISFSGDGTMIDCKDREYYQTGIRGESGICYIEKSRFTNGPILLFYTPLYYEGEIIGVVNGILDTRQLAGRLENTFFGYSAAAGICTRDGRMVAASWEKNGDAAGQAEPEDPFSGGAMSDEAKRQADQAIDQAILAGQSLSFRYAGRTGEGNAYITPVSDGKFMLVQTFPSAISHAITEHANQDMLKLEAAAIAVFLIYFGALAFYVWRRSRKLTREKESLGQIVDSVKRLYRRFVIFDLEEDRYEYLEKGNIITLGLPEQGKYSEWWEAFRAQHDVNPKFWGSMENMTVERLQETLTQENWYTHREYPTPDGHWERLSLIKLDMESARTNRVLGAVEDITEVKKQEEAKRQALEAAYHAAEAANHAKSDFLSRMSHDIRTPMNAIIGLTAIMASRLDDRERVTDCLSKITSSSKHLLGLINEVLDMSKIESGKLVLSEAEFSLSALMDNLLDMVQPTVKAKHQEFTVYVENLTHEHVIGDSLRLQQVCVNILSNAVKYTGEGGHITVTLSERPGKQPMLGEYTFLFQDNGIGMKQEFLEKIFSPFERADDERISTIQGTGLGMAIAQSVVQLMGGTIQVESEVGKGSKFTVQVSLKLREEYEATEECLVGLPILVADDEQITCETTCLMLTELGMQGEWVLTGKEAVERVKEQRSRGEDFFAVILDWKMPGMDGVETARAIRREVGPDVPIIILSAYDWSEIENEAKDAGVNAFIGKPLFKSRLKSVFMSLRTDEMQKIDDPLSEVKEKDYSGKRVLLAEDNELNQEIAQEILGMTGLSVEVAENGKVAVERFNGSPIHYYDIIFMDIQMPIMDGYGAARAIRALAREDAADVPIVAMTANTFSEDVQAALDAGMNQHIGKPLDMEQLMTTLKKWLE